jgi:hypothetical protein
MDELYSEDDHGLAECERYHYELAVAYEQLLLDDAYPTWLERLELENDPCQRN